MATLERSTEDDDEEDDSDMSQRPPKAQKTYVDVDLDSDEEEVAVLYGLPPKPPTIVINDDKEVTEVTRPKISEVIQWPVEDMEVKYFHQ